MDCIVMNKSLKITIIGAGNGGQAMAGHCAMKGFLVCLYNRTIEKLQTLVQKNAIELYGGIEGVGYLNCVTDDLEQAITFADIIMIVTTATAHRSLAYKIAPYLRKGQIIVLNPGRTGGAFEFFEIFRELSIPRIYLAEAQTLIYACRKKEEGIVHVIGVKDKVLLSGISTEETSYIINVLSDVFSCSVPAENLLHTSLENIGAIFHPCVVMFNAATIERGTSFYFYREMTPQIARFIQAVDEERLNIGKAFGLNLISVTEWISYAYPGVQGDDLCDKMKNNPAYYDILSPESIFSRQLLEDIPMGLLPMVELGSLAGVKVELMKSIITICSSLLGIDFWKSGRTLSNIGLSHKSKDEIIRGLSL